MKKNLLSIICTTIFCVGLLNTAFAQLQWLWAKAYSGIANDYNRLDRYNAIIRSAFDDDGNIYVIGTFHDPAQIDGERIFPYWLDEGLEYTCSGQFIAKFDIDGNLVWKKVIKSLNNNQSPKGIQVRGNRVYAMGNITFNVPTLNSYFYYLDTLVRIALPWDDVPDSYPMPFCFRDYVNYFITFDLDGNVIKQHFLGYEDREPYDGLPYIDREALIGLHNGLFYVDKSDNIYMFISMSCVGDDPSKPLHTIIDKELRDSFYIRYAAPPAGYTGDQLLFKFSSNFDLLWAKPIVSHTDGFPETFGEGARNPVAFHFTGLSADEDDNLYISGYAATVAKSQMSQYQFPIKYYFDSTHYGVVYDFCSSMYSPFLIKYDTAGNVLWNQQLHAKGDTDDTLYRISILYHGSIVKEQFVFVCGLGGQHDLYERDTICIDAAMQIPLARSNPNHTGRSGIFCYDKETGEYINHGIIPADYISKIGRYPAVINNYILANGSYGMITQIGNRLIARFYDDGIYIGADTVYSPPFTKGSLYIADVAVHPSGYLFTHFPGSDRATFGDITVTGGEITAFFGMMYDPSLLTPYVNIIEPPFVSAYFTLYPNPTNADIYIRLLVDEMLFEKAELYGVQGQKLGEYKELHIPARNLPAGMYLLKVYVDKQIITAKFLKTN